MEEGRCREANMILVVLVGSKMDVCTLGKCVCMRERRVISSIRNQGHGSEPRVFTAVLLVNYPEWGG